MQKVFKEWDYLMAGLPFSFFFADKINKKPDANGYVLSQKQNLLFVEGMLQFSWLKWE